MNGEERTGYTRDHHPELRQSADVLRCDVLSKSRGGLRRVSGYRIPPESGRIDPEDCGKPMSLARKWALLPPVGVMEVLRLVDGGMVPGEAIRLMFDVVCKAKWRKCDERDLQRL